MSILRGLTVNADTGLVTIARGDDQTIRFTVTDSTGAVVNITAGGFAFTVKQSIDDAIGSALFQKTSPAGSGIDLTSGASGIADVNIVPADTSAMAGNYVWDLQMTLSSKVRTLAGGVFMVRKDVTTVGTAPTSSSALVSMPGGFYLGSGGFYLLDTVTGLYSGFRLTNGIFEQSAAQSATVPFTY
jgi:hypothetical protein